MMNWVLQQAIFNRLNVTAITNLVAGIYDHVPQPIDSADDTAFPYIVIGAVRVSEDDTDDVLGFDARAEVHVWSRQRGRKQTKEIQDAIYARLHRADLTITGYHSISCDHEFSESVVDADGLTRHGVQQFRILFDEVTT